MAITVKTKEEIEILREGGRLLAEILDKVVGAAEVGISTFELDRLAESLIFSSGGEPSFKGYQGKGSRTPYPCAMCVSVNDEVVHAIPKKDRMLREGDIVGLDIGMQWPAGQTQNSKLPLSGARLDSGGKTQNLGLFTDMAVTIGIGKISPEAEKLIQVVKEALALGIWAVRPGVRVGDVSSAIQAHLEKYRFGIIRDLAGHGVGYQVHEEPLIPNFGKPGTGQELQEGMVFALEPMVTLGDWRVRLAEDGWALKTVDGSLAAHFEHTVAVTKDGVEVLTRV